MNWFKSKSKITTENKIIARQRIDMLINSLIAKELREHYVFPIEDITLLESCKEEIINKCEEKFESSSSYKKEINVFYLYDVLRETICHVLYNRFSCYRIENVNESAKERICSKLTYAEKAMLLSKRNVDWIELEKELLKFQ